VAEIQETIGADQIRYIKFNYNPADALMRGIHLNRFMKWSGGPSFLELPEEKWPNFEDHTQFDTHVDDFEASKEKKTFQKEKKARKHYSASAEVCPELDQPESGEKPILLHLLKTCSTIQDTEDSCLRLLFYSPRSEHEPGVRAHFSSGTEGCRDPSSEVESISRQ